MKTSSEIDKILEHHGVRGQKWGVRRKNVPGGRSPAEDAVRAKEFGKIAKKKGGVHTLSNQELQLLVTRMNLEQQYSRLSNPKKELLPKLKAGKHIIDTLLGLGKTANDAMNFANSPSGKIMSDALKAKLKTAKG